jgi:hypothetical protein
VSLLRKKRTSSVRSLESLMAQPGAGCVWKEARDVDYLKHESRKKVDLKKNSSFSLKQITHCIFWMYRLCFSSATSWSLARRLVGVGVLRACLATGRALAPPQGHAASARRAKPFAQRQDRELRVGPQEREIELFISWNVWNYSIATL